MYPQYEVITFMPQIIRLYQSNPSISIDIEKILSVNPVNLGVLHQVNVPLFWLNKLSLHLKRHPHLLLKSSIEAILVSFSKEEARLSAVLKSLDVKQLLEEFALLAKQSEAKIKITITSTGVMLNHLNFSGIPGWSSTVSCTRTLESLANLDDEESSEEDFTDASDEEEAEQKRSGNLAILRSQWQELKGKIAAQERHIHTRSNEIVRYFNLPVEQHEDYKTKSYITQKEFIKTLTLKIKPDLDMISSIISIHDATLNNAHQFILPYLIAVADSPVSKLQSYLTRASQPSDAQAHLKALLLQEQDSRFAYLNQYRRYEVFAALYLHLQDYKMALEQFERALFFAKSQPEHYFDALRCEKIMSSLSSLSVNKERSVEQEQQGTDLRCEGR